MTLCSLDIVVMPMHRGSSERTKGELGLFVAVRVMIEGYVQTHDKGACPGGQPKSQDHGSQNPMSRAAHGRQYCRSRLMGQCNKGACEFRALHRIESLQLARRGVKKGTSGNRCQSVEPGLRDRPEEPLEGG